MSLLVVLVAWAGVEAGRGHPTMLPAWRQGSAIPLPASTMIPGLSKALKSIPTAGLPDGFWRYLLDLLLLQTTQELSPDLLKQRAGQDAPQGQEPAEELLDLGNTVQEGRKMLLMELGVLQTHHAELGH